MTTEWRNRESSSGPLTAVPTVYSPEYYAATPTQSMRKLPEVARAIKELGLAEFRPAGDADILPALRRLHGVEYVEAVRTGVGSLARSNGFDWTPEIRDGVLAMNRGQLLGVELALEHGLAANVAQGFHHAGPEGGAGFCTFNGLALIAQERPDLKVFVMDCDAHGGDGTSRFVGRFANLYNHSICGDSFGFEEGQRAVCEVVRVERGDFQPYLEAMERMFQRAEAWGPDLVVYQAGADAHEDDPLGSVMLSRGMMAERDVRVFQACRDHGWPVLFVLAGGYQKMTSLLPLHVQTFQAAVEVYGPSGEIPAPDTLVRSEDDHCSQPAGKSWS